MILNICSKFAKISKSVSELSSEHNLHTEIYQGGHNYMKTIGRVMQPFSAHHLMTLYICTKFQANISKGSRVIKWTHTEIYEGT